jgi:hypothetical protein
MKWFLACMSFLMVSLTAQSFAAIAQTHASQVESIQGSTLNTTINQLEKTGLTASQLLLVFDDDNTLETTDKFGCQGSATPRKGATCQFLGSVAWSTWQSGLLKTDPQSKRLVAKTADAFYNVENTIFGLISMVPTEPNLAAYINTIELAGVPTIVETARSADMLNNTQHQLAYAGFKFTDLEPNLSLDFKPSASGREVALQHGVMAVAGQNKGQVLLSLFAHIKALYPNYTAPKAVLFVDDTNQNDIDVLTALKAKAIRVYTFTDNHMQPWVSLFANNRLKRQASRRWDRLQHHIQRIIAHSLIGG